MAELSVMDLLLIILSVLFLSIALAMRRLRIKMENDMKKNVVPFLGMRHMIKHKAHEVHKIKGKRR